MAVTQYGGFGVINFGSTYFGAGTNAARTAVTVEISYSVDSVLVPADGYVALHSVDSLLRGVNSVNHHIDALLGGTGSLTYDIDSLLSGRTSLSHAIDSILLYRGMQSHFIDAAIKDRLSLTHTINSSLHIAFYLMHTIDSSLRVKQPDKPYAEIHASIPYFSIHKDRPNTG